LSAPGCHADDDPIVVPERCPRLRRIHEVDGHPDPRLLDPQGGDFQVERRSARSRCSRGHVPVAKKKSTRRYSGIDPYAPDYMSKAIAAVEAFVREVNKHAKKRDLDKPYTIKPGWKGRK
jgi:hypothetical protein